jgi:uncharacterized protein (TIGR03435 family)
MANDDLTLLREYARQNSEPAFAELVERHIKLVYSVALRQVRDAHLAEEVTQAVFIILAQKANSLSDKVILSGWLCRVARCTSAKLLRTQLRRSQREQEAYIQSMVNKPESANWGQIAPVLDDALEKLEHKDHDALVLRYFENRSFAEVGAALGATEGAAKMRVGRALEKLRTFISRRGVVSTAAALAEGLSVNSVQAVPLSLGKTVTAMALSKGAAVSTSTLTLTQGAMKIMAWTKIKTIVGVGLGALLAVGTTIIVVKEVQDHRTYPWQVTNANSQEGVNALNTTPPQVTIVPSKYKTDAGRGGLLDDIPPQNQWRYIGIHSTPAKMIERAYFDGTSLTPSEIAWPPNMPNGYYDYIANLPSGSQQALQTLIKKKFGLVGKYEDRSISVLLLQAASPSALKLTPSAPQPAGNKQPMTPVSNGFAHYKNLSMFKLAEILKSRIQMPVIDQTGLTGNYDMEIPDNPDDSATQTVADTERWLIKSFGLKLVPTNMPIKMLVVEKAT